MKLQEFEEGVRSYCENRVIPELKTTFDKWMLRAALAVAKERPAIIRQRIVPILAGVGLLGDDEDVDLDLLEKVGKEAFEKQPRLDIWKITFKREDFSDFIRFLHGER